jgi:hypothetical protein
VLWATKVVAIDRHAGLSEQMSIVHTSSFEVMQGIYNNQIQNLNSRFALVTAYLMRFFQTVPNLIRNKRPEVRNHEYLS